MRDPELRKRYEKAIADNEEKKRAHSLQLQARRLAKWFPGKAERFLKDAYTRPPAALEEFEKLVKANLAETEVRARLLLTVKGE